MPSSMFRHSWGSPMGPMPGGVGVISPRALKSRTQNSAISPDVNAPAYPGEPANKVQPHWASPPAPLEGSQRADFGQTRDAKTQPAVFAPRSTPIFRPDSGPPNGAPGRLVRIQPSATSFTRPIAVVSVSVSPTRCATKPKTRCTPVQASTGAPLPSHRTAETTWRALTRTNRPNQSSAKREPGGE